MAVEAPDEAAELGRRAVVADGGERGGEDAAVRAAVAQGDAVPEGGDPVAVRARNPLDESAPAQAAEVVRGAARSVGARPRLEQRSRMLAEVAVGEPRGQQPERQQRREQGLDAGVAEAQRAGAAVADHGRTVQAVERLLAEGRVVADALDAEQASVGREADPFQIVKVAQLRFTPKS